MVSTVFVKQHVIVDCAAAIITDFTIWSTKRIATAKNT